MLKTLATALVISLGLSIPSFAQACKSPAVIAAEAQSVAAEVIITLKDADLDAAKQFISKNRGVPVENLSFDMIEIYKSEQIDNLVIMLYKDGCALNGVVEPEKFVTDMMAYIKTGV